MIARIHNQHNAAVAEVADNDRWQICRLGVAVGSNRSDQVDSQLAAIVRMVERERDLSVIDLETEIG